MRKLYRFAEAAEKFFGGDTETLRHALLLGVIRARVELCDEYCWWVWDSGESADDYPSAGDCEHGKWVPRGSKIGYYGLTGWFLVAKDQAAKIAHGKEIPRLYVSPDEEEEVAWGLVFSSTKHVEVGDLWFEPSKFPNKTIDPDDQKLDDMADSIERLSQDEGLIARFRIAANAGMEGTPSQELAILQEKFYMLSAIAVAKAAAAEEREKHRLQRSKGGLKKAANAKPNPEKEAAVNLAKANPKLSATQIKMRLSLKASPRTIRAWLAAY